MVSKSTFRTFSLEHANGNYFLRPDYILGVFHVDHNRRLPFDIEVLAQCQIEKTKENNVLNDLLKKETMKKHNNLFRVDMAIDQLWNNETRTLSRNRNSMQSSSSSIKMMTELTSQNEKESVRTSSSQNDHADTDDDDPKFEDIFETNTTTKTTKETTKRSSSSLLAESLLTMGRRTSSGIFPTKESKITTSDIEMQSPSSTLSSNQMQSPIQIDMSENPMTVPTSPAHHSLHDHDVGNYI